jgi:hypothetical protein
MDILDGDNADIQNLYNPSLTYGPAGFDRTQNVLLSAIYELPLGPGKRFATSKNIFNRELIGGWQLSAIQQFATGQPISVTANNNADTSSVHSVYANRICDGTPPVGHTRLQFFNPACYVQPATGQYGTARSGPRQPGIDTTNIGIQKRLRSLNISSCSSGRRRSSSSITPISAPAAQVLRIRAPAC